MGKHEISEKVLRYEAFLNDTLKEDLRKVLEERDKIYADLAEYLQLKHCIETLQDSNAQDHPLRTKIDVGCNFYMQAKVWVHGIQKCALDFDLGQLSHNKRESLSSDPSKICVAVGYGFFVEFTFPEALTFIDKKVAHLTTISDQMTKDAVKIKTNIRLVLQGLQEIQGIDDKAQEKPQRDIFSYM